MTIHCPHCGAPLDIGDQQIGERVHHPRCGLWVLVGRRRNGEKYAVKVEPPDRRVEIGGRR